MGATVVVGTDGSGPSRAAIDWALVRAACLGLDLEIVHVIDERRRGLHDTDDVRRRAEVAVDAEVTRALALASGPAVSGRIILGLPPKTLIDASRDAALLVVGTHKTGFIYGRAFESRFLSLGSRAFCAVAVIPEFIGRSRRGVVAAAQLDEAGARAIEFATREAVRTDQVLVIVAAWAVGPGTGDDADGRSELVEAAASAARHVDASVTVRSRVSNGTMSEALIAASATASVLVLARSGSEPDDPNLAVNRDVLANISSPVIVTDPASRA